MFTFIRKHQSITLIFMGLVIISFLFFFSPDMGGPGGPSADYGWVNGRKIEQVDFQKAYEEASLQYFFSVGAWPSGSSTQFIDMEKNTRQRLFLNLMLEEMKIEPDSETIAEWIATRFSDVAGEGFDRKIYQSWMDNAFKPRGITEKDFRRYVQHEIGIQHLRELSSIGGRMVPPGEAELQFRRDNEQIKTKVVFFTSAKHRPLVKVTDEKLSEYYNKNQAGYRIQDKFQVKYVKFDSAQLQEAAEIQLTEKSDLQDEIQKIYDRNGAAFYQDGEENTLSEEDAKSKIRQDIKDELALDAAFKASIEFSTKLYAMKPHKTENLVSLAEQEGYQVQTTQPFARFDRLANLNVPDNFTASAVELTEDDPFADPIKADDGVYFLAFDKKIPSRIQTLEEVKARVTSQFNSAEARRMAEEEGAAFHSRLVKEMKEEKTFEEICTTSNLVVVDLPAFSKKTSSLKELSGKASLTSLRNKALELNSGEISGFSKASQGGFIVYLENKEPASEESMKEELPAILTTLQRSRSFEAYSSWLQIQIEQAGLTAPETNEEPATLTDS